MMVTTGGRCARSPWACSTWASSSLSASSLPARTTLWPSSSVTRAAVSWSMVWVMVTITPILNSALTTSPPFSASFCARSATVIESPMATSRTTGAVGRSKPPAPALPPPRLSMRRGLALPPPGLALERRARSAADRCNWPANRLAEESSSSMPATIACEPRVLCLWPRPSSTGRSGAGRCTGVPRDGRAVSAPSSLGCTSAALRASSSAWRWASSSRRLRSFSSARTRSSSASRCCSARLRWRDSSSLRRTSACSASTGTTGVAAAVAGVSAALLT